MGLLLVVGCVLVGLHSTTAATARARTSFDFGWRFHKGSVYVQTLTLALCMSYDTALQSHRLCCATLSLKVDSAVWLEV
jgi:hypothetical protein